MNFERKERGRLCLSLSSRRIIAQNKDANTGDKSAMILNITKYFYKDKK